METGDYGYVFQPRQATQSRDWRPYINGHWVYTDAGWTWISDEPFGWATYHYGRWTRLRSVGWVWVPGEQWAPAWVSWRRGNSYVGWAPLPPEAQFDRQTGIRNWADNYYDIGPEHDTLRSRKPIRRQNTCWRSSFRPSATSQSSTQTINVTNITYNNSLIVDRGPSYDELRAQSSQPIERFRLEPSHDLANERPTFHGDVVKLPTLKFRPTEQTGQAPRISRTIAQPVVESGWANIKDQQAAQKARDKMQAEATPPPNAPAKKFVRPANKTIQPRPSPIIVSTPAIRATPGPSPTVKTLITPTRPAAPVAKPRPVVATPAPNEAAMPAITPRAPAANRVPTSTPSVAAGDNDSTEPTNHDQRPPANASQQERQRQRQEAQAARRSKREQMMEQRREKKTKQPEASPSPSAPSP